GNRNVNCAQLKRKGNNVTTEYHINLPNPVRVKCDMETKGGGWTVIQRRGKYEKSEENLFERTGEEYNDGFGDPAVSNWIGNLLELRDTEKRQSSALGLSCVVSFCSPRLAAVSKEQNSCGSAHRRRYDALGPYNAAKFFIAKNDYAVMVPGCYPPLSGGWWFHECVHSNLNGRKFKSTDTKNKRGLGITWLKKNDEKSYDTVYNTVEMKIRDADFDFCMGNMAT
ncbi:unnamed protein product, partial [Ixodes pacificus]